MSNQIFLTSSKADLGTAIRESLQETGILDQISPDTKVSLKPNLTYPYHRPGVTTSPQFMRETVRVLRDYTTHIAIVETDGGYGAWAAKEAFSGHGLYDLVNEFAIEVVNLCDEAQETIQFNSRGQMYKLPLPVRLLYRTDVFITLPVPKIHCMTGLTLSYKNQWGCIPDIMRLRRHYIFDDAIVAINQALRPVVLADGTYFLDRNGPMEGSPIRMDLVIAANNAGTFDRYVSELMGVSWKQISHLKRAAALKDMPTSLQEMSFNISPAQARTHTFRLERTLRNWVSLAGFHSRFLTWLGYESWFGRVILHTILYAIAGKPVKPSSSLTKHQLEDIQ
jgi:uncharacterized protein (DUF362 family)